MVIIKLTGNTIRHHRLRVAVDDALHARIPLVHLAVDAPLRVALGRARGDVARHDEDVGFGGVADGEVAVGLEDAVLRFH